MSDRKKAPYVKQYMNMTSDGAACPASIEITR